jgi:hypothetical protein
MCVLAFGPIAIVALARVGVVILIGLVIMGLALAVTQDGAEVWPPSVMNCGHVPRCW